LPVEACGIGNVSDGIQGSPSGAPFLYMEIIMKKNLNLALLLLTVLFLTMAVTVVAPAAEKMAKAENYVRIVPNEAAGRVDVFVDQERFTSYIFPKNIMKPVLWPIHTASGKVITRGYPLNPQPFERVDHPHHVGLWFNYGDVNGLDFWNNSESVRPAQKSQMGTILHRRVKQALSGKGKGTLTVEMDWVNSEGKVLLKEEATYIFRAEKQDRIIDRICTLTAQEEAVLLKDNKEGVLGLRVTRALEQPSTRPEIFTDSSGKPTKVPVLNNEGVSGQYLTSEGKTGDAVWGTRGKWCLLAGKLEGEDVSVAILDHPKNPGYPTYWHARGYGLFAANTLGQKALSNGKEELNYKLEPKKSGTFRYRVLILPEAANPEHMEKCIRRFHQEVK